MFNGKAKALTFSYDDGISQDERLIEIFNKYGLKATFNINSGLLGTEYKLSIENKDVSHIKFKPEDVKKVYKGHEIASHTLTHPRLTQLSEAEIITQVEEDREALSRIAGYNVVGMAYPCGGNNQNERVANIIRQNTYIKYARTIISNYSFGLQDDLYRFHPTVHHVEWNKMWELTKTFIDSKSARPSLFYIWGHSYEFDIDNTWDDFEEICKELSRRDDIFYGTNREVFGL